MLIISDITGKTQMVAVAHKPYRRGNHTLAIKGNDLPDGLYFLTISIDGKHIGQKTLVKQSVGR
jgi:hypothetical protein